MSERPRSAGGDWLQRICGPTEMGEMVAGHDWAATPLGDPVGWSNGLRAAVSICMTTRFPLLVVWGPKLIKIYNDGYRVMLGDHKHPAALGAPAETIWQEVWEIIGALFDHVLTTGEPTWDQDQLLVIERNGFAEECYFTFSYSPLFEEDGSVGGVLDVAVETTEQVVSERRLRCLADLTAALMAAEHITDVYRLAASVLRRGAPDLVAADLYLQAEGQLSLMASNRRPGRSSADKATLAGVMTTGAPVVDGDHDGGRLPAKRYVAPIGGGFGSVEGLLVLDLSPQRAFDDGYRTFVELVAQVIGSALDSAYRRSVEVGEYRRLNDSLKAALLQPASDFATVAARYLPADGRLAIGGDWYDIIDLGDDKRALVVGDCVGHGLDAATVMAQLRSASRAMLLDDQDPASALTALDSFATTLDGAFCTTAICAVVDRRKGSITYSRAGHLPPLVVASNSVAWLDGAGGVPLGLDPSPPRYNETYELPPDSMFVLFTDGLVERPGERIDTGLERLAAAALELIGTSTVQELADGLLARMIDGDVRDDVVVVAKHLPPQRARVSD